MKQPDEGGKKSAHYQYVKKGSNTEDIFVAKPRMSVEHFNCA